MQAIKEIHKYRGNIIQIFVSDSKQINNASESMDEYEEIKQYAIKHRMQIVIHSSYLINLGREWDETSWWLTLLRNEMEIAQKLSDGNKPTYVVVHMGERLNRSREAAINFMFTALVHLLNKTEKTCPDVEILLETGAGQGTQIGHQLEEFSQFHRKFTGEEDEVWYRLGICVDTCHLFAAGYDLRTVSAVDKVWKKLDELEISKFIRLIHLNDSAKELGSRVDRHAELGKGLIGMTGIEAFARESLKREIPILLETPNKAYRREIDMLRNLV